MDQQSQLERASESCLETVGLGQPRGGFYSHLHDVERIAEQPIAIAIPALGATHRPPVPVPGIVLGQPAATGSWQQVRISRRPGVLPILHQDGATGPLAEAHLDARDVARLPPLDPDAPCAGRRILHGKDQPLLPFKIMGLALCRGRPRPVAQTAERRDVDLIPCSRLVLFILRCRHVLLSGAQVVLPDARFRPSCLS